MEDTTSLQTGQKQAPKLQYLVQCAINECRNRRIAKVSAPLHRVMSYHYSHTCWYLTSDIVGASRSYRNWYSANYRKFTIRKSSTVKIRGQH